MTKAKKTLPPYEHLFSAQSLKRAYEYVDYVENVQFSQNGISCKVEGSYPYKVKIAWNDNDYTELSCTCPYDYEGYCKHIAAVLMYIEEEEEFLEIPTATKKQKKPEWKQIIEKLSKEELQAFLIEYATDDESLINTIMIKYATPIDRVDIQKYKKIVNNIFSSASDDFGFIHYQDVYGVSHLISNLSDKAISTRKKAKFEESFSISAAMCEVCIDYIQNLDDSSGWIGGLIYDTFRNIENVFHECKNETLENLVFEWLSKQMKNPDYSDYGCDEGLESIYFELGSNSPYTESTSRFIDEQLSQYEKGTDWSSKYRYNKFLMHKLALLEKQEKTEEAQLLIEENLQLSDIRKIKVNQLLEQKDFFKAIACIKEGIGISEQENLAGVTRNWNNLLLQIYQEQNMQYELHYLARSMFLNHSESMEYYRIYKRTVEKAKWSAELASIIDELKKRRKTNAWHYHFSYDLANIYIEEKMWGELFIEVKDANDISVTSRYAKYLQDGFSPQLIDIYRDSIVKYAQRTGRNIYEDTKKYLKEMSKLKNGLFAAKVLKEELLNTYKNRPAMKEILSPLFR